MEVKQQQLYLDGTTAVCGETSVRVIAPVNNADARLLLGSATACVERCEPSAGEITVEGTLYCRAVLEGDEQSACSATQGFEVRIKVPSVSARASVSAQAQVQCNAYKESGALVFDCRVSVNALCTEPQEAVAVESLEGTGLQVCTQNADYTRLVGVYRTHSVVQQELALSVRMPQVKQMLQVLPCVTVTEKQILHGEVHIAGEIQLNMLYSCGDEYEPVVQLADKIPFTGIVEASGAREGDEAFISICAENTDIQVLPNEQQENRLLDCKAQLVYTVTVLRPAKSCFVTDAYSTECNLERTYKQVVFTKCTPATARQSVRVILEKPADAEPMARISAVQAVPFIKQVETESGTKLACCLRAQVLYIVSGSGELASFTADTDFDVNCDCGFTAGMQVQAFLSTEMMQAALMGSSKLEVRLVLQAGLLGISTCKTQLLATAKAGEPRTNGGGMSIYVMQKGDTFFSIGEQLGVTQEDIAAFNPDAEPAPGTRLIIFKRLSVPDAL